MGGMVSSYQASLLWNWLPIWVQDAPALPLGLSLNLSFLTVVTGSLLVSIGSFFLLLESCSSPLAPHDHIVDNGWMDGFKWIIIGQNWVCI